jgi:hypothetical protein
MHRKLFIPKKSDSGTWHSLMRQLQLLAADGLSTTLPSNPDYSWFEVMILRDISNVAPQKREQIMIPMSGIKALCLSCIILSVLFSPGCDIIDSPDVEVRPIECNIIFSVEEGYRNSESVSEPEIKLSMVTEAWYSCSDWSILSYLVVRKKRIAVNLIGIYKPRYCSMMFGPATSFSFLNISNGEYPLYFTYKGVTDKYKLTVTDSAIRISEEYSHFTQPEFTLYWRCPSNSFVYMCGTTTENSWICGDFLDTLSSEIHLEEIYFPDSCGLLYPRTSMGHSYDMPAKYFRYENEADFDKAGEILKSYTRSHSDFSIYLINWKNKKYLSWLIDNTILQYFNS